MSTLLSTLSLSQLDRQTQILLLLGEFYCLTIGQVMELCSWKSYPKATVALKKIVEQLIYRLRRHGYGTEIIKGDAYFLLSNGAKELRESGFEPTFSFEPKQAAKNSVVPIEHTLLVNEVLIKLWLFQAAHANRFR